MCGYSHIVLNHLKLNFILILILLIFCTGGEKTKNTNGKIHLRINQGLSKIIYAVILIVIVVVAVVAAYAYMTSTNQPKDIVDTAIANGSFTTLVTALTAANLTDALKGTGPFTVFAPTDAAFNALPTGLLNELLAEHHGSYPSLDLPCCIR